MKNQPTLPLGDGDVLSELKEQTKWLRFLGLRALGPILTDQLRSDREKLAYELSDGIRSSRAIAPLVGVSFQSIADWWKKWIAAGIATDIGGGRAQRLASLAQLGIAVPVTTPKEKTPPPQRTENEEATSGKSND